MATTFNPTDYGYNATYADTREEMKEAWLDAAEQHYSHVFRSGQELRVFLRDHGVEEWIESATHSRRNRGWRYRAKIKVPTTQNGEYDHEEYQRRYDRVKDLLKDTNAFCK